MAQWQAPLKRFHAPTNRFIGKEISCNTTTQRVGGTAGSAGAAGAAGLALGRVGGAAEGKVGGALVLAGAAVPAGT